MSPDEKLSPPPRLIPSTRFILALLVSFALFVQYAQRVSLAMAIVCMVNRTAMHSLTNNTSPENMKMKHGPSFLSEKQFRWTEFQQQIVLGAHWLGYILTLGPGLSMVLYLTLKLVHFVFVFQRRLALNQDWCHANIRLWSSAKFYCHGLYGTDVLSQRYPFHCRRDLPRHRGSRTWTTLSCHLHFLVDVGCATRTQHTHLHRLL